MSKDVVSIWIGRIVVGAAVVLSIRLYAYNWWYIGPLYILFAYPAWTLLAFAGVLLTRRPHADPWALAFATLAAGTVPAQLAGGLLERFEYNKEAIGILTHRWNDDCGIGTATDLTRILSDTWPVWATLTFCVATFWRANRAGTKYGGTREIAALTAGLLAPTLIVMACLAVLKEFMRGGAGIVVLYPAAVAAGWTAWTWIRNRPSPSVRALRRIVGLVLLATVLGATTFSPPQEGGPETSGDWNTHTWRLLHLDSLGIAFLMLGIVLWLASEPPGVAATSETPR